jgi:hypothetical protein
LVIDVTKLGFPALGVRRSFWHAVPFLDRAGRACRQALRAVRLMSPPYVVRITDAFAQATSRVHDGINLVCV